MPIVEQPKENQHHCYVKGEQPKDDTITVSKTENQDDRAKFLAVVPFLDAHKRFRNQEKDTKTRH